MITTICAWFSGRSVGWAFMLATLGWAEGVKGADSELKVSPVSAPPVSRAFPQMSPPPLPPVAQFNRLLNASPGERTNQLVGKSRSARDLILQELAAVDAMSSADREQRILRLRMAQLRFYLVPLMRAEGSQRAEQLARVPEIDRALLEARLEVWDRLPARERSEVLESEATLQLFVRQASARAATEAENRGFRAVVSPEVANAWDNWRKLPDGERSRREEKLRQFFELSADDQTQVLGMLPDRERRRMDLTLKQFSGLAPKEREQCVRNFDQLARLPESGREEFLRNAAKWQAMSQAERDAWRRLVLPEPPLPPIRLGRVAGQK